MTGPFAQKVTIKTSHDSHWLSFAPFVPIRPDLPAAMPKPPSASSLALPPSPTSQPAPSDRNRRIWLKATTGLGVSGAALMAGTLVGSLQPTEREAQAAAGITVDIGDLPAGQKRVVQWRGKPVWIVRRTPAMLAALQQLDPAELADPDSRRTRLPTPAFARNVWRSRRPEVFVCVGLCSHLGCAPIDRFQAGAQAGLPGDLPAHWPGGFVCPCHGSTFDLAGRVFKNKTATDNLEVPPYVFLSDTQLWIGSETKG